MRCLTSLALALLAAACFQPTGLPTQADGSASSGGADASAPTGQDAATLVPPDAAFVPGLDAGPVAGLDAATLCSDDPQCPSGEVCAPDPVVLDCRPRCVTGCHRDSQCAKGRHCLWSGTSPSCVCQAALCAGTCVEDAPMDAGVISPVDAGCVGEGGHATQMGPNSTLCCAGLDALPELGSTEDGECLVPNCACVVCALRCGTGVCSAGKDSCNCAIDCPLQLPNGPGAACTAASDCAYGSTCMPASYSFPTGGYCFGAVCTPSSSLGVCPAGSICTPVMFSQAPGHCMPACRSDADCRSDLTCEFLASYPGPIPGTYVCWQDKAGAAALGKPCKQDSDCLSMICNAHPNTGKKVCSAYCDSDTPCKKQQSCVPLGGCGTPGCGGCF